MMWLRMESPRNSRRSLLRAGGAMGQGLLQQVGILRTGAQRLLQRAPAVAVTR